MQNVSKEVFEQKYMLHGEKDIEELFRLVAREIASAEKKELRSEIEDRFYREMISGRLIPAGRILANARPESPMKNYNNCFTIDIEDSMDGIYDSLKEDALISKMGGGVGFDVSKLRPKGEKLSGGGEASGGVSFLRIFDQSAKTIMTGGHRRSAHIALLDVSHPDVEEFITVKQGDKNKELTQFNISVKISDAFVKAVNDDADWDLTYEGKVYKTVRARELYELLATNAFYNNEPGIFNSDIVEKYNNGYWAFKMDRVNPCGELVMPPYSLCCLAAINLTAFVENPFTDEARFDWDAFRDTVHTSVRFLDNVLDTTDYPLEKIRKFSKQWRRIGLGFTGLGNLFTMMQSG
jgi:ribonucleoside-diphosphate reductase alpha chain